MSSLKISKLDAARRQLEIAVRLYFATADPVSIHALTSAAYQLLDDLGAKLGGPIGLKDQFIAHIKPEHQASVRRKLNEAQNFFKHAGQDHDQVLDFYPDGTEFFLADACERYEILAKEKVPLLSVFRTWFIINGAGKGLTVPMELEKLRQSARTIPESATRAQFLAEVLPIAALGRLGDRSPGT